MRLMGKRQIGELQPYEFVITIMISDLAALPMQDTASSFNFRYNTYNYIAIYKNNSDSTST